MRIDELIAERVVFFDGASGTMMQAAGLPVGASPDIWNIERAETVRDMHLRYLNAGSDVISTVTFRAGTFEEGDAKRIIEVAVQNCEKSIDRYRADTGSGRPLFTALDIGPSGKLVGISGGPNFCQTYEYFRKQVIAGADAGTDMILFETFTDVYELKAAVLAAIENTSLPVLATVTFEAGGRTMMGTDAMTAALMFRDMGLTAFGVNCSLGPNEMLPVVRDIAKYAKAPAMAQPNAGLPRIENGAAVYNIGTAEFSEAVAEIVGAGARVVGGCCGTTPEYIETLINSISKNKELNVMPEQESIYPSVCATGASLILKPDNKYTMKHIKISDTDTKKIQTEIKKLAKEADLVAVELDTSLAGGIKDIAVAASSLARIPIAFKSDDADILDKAIRVSRGKPAIIIQSKNNETSISCTKTAKKYGTAVIIEDKTLPERIIIEHTSAED